MCYNDGTKSFDVCNSDLKQCIDNTCSTVLGIKNPLCLAQAEVYYVGVSSSQGKEAWKASKLDDGYLACQ
jgi:hypothetical protein